MHHWTYNQVYNIMYQLTSMVTNRYMHTMITVTLLAHACMLSVNEYIKPLISHLLYMQLGLWCMLLKNNMTLYDLYSTSMTWKSMHATCLRSYGCLQMCIIMNWRSPHGKKGNYSAYALLFYSFYIIINSFISLMIGMCMMNHIAIIIFFWSYQ